MTLPGKQLSWILAIVFLFCAAASSAHVFAPALLAVRQTSDGIYAVSWKQPVVRTKGSRLVPRLPRQCVRTDAAFQARSEDTGFIEEWEIDCQSGLVGSEIAVQGIAASGANVLIRIELADGRTLHRVLTPDEPVYRIPERQSHLSVVGDYVEIGIDHILTGWDHLLFVLGLVLLLGWGRALAWAVTAFTLGHSITLAVAVLGFVRFPPALVEVMIAFSIYLLAIELVRSSKGKQAVMERAPWLVATGFGLLHGLGFAGSLAETGLPSGNIPLALFAFNLGIEFGQLFILGVALLAFAALRRLALPWPAWTHYLPAYGIGCMAAFWLFERVAAVLSRAM